MVHHPDRMIISRRNLLISASATAAFAVAKANAPIPALESLVESRPAWLPEGFMLPNGQTLSRLMYPDLYAVIGNMYGGGPTTFKLPDLGIIHYRPGQPIGLISTGAKADFATTPAGTMVNFIVPTSVS